MDGEIHDGLPCSGTGAKRSVRAAYIVAMRSPIPRGRGHSGAVRRAAAPRAEVRGVPQSGFMEGAARGSGMRAPPGLPREVVHLVG